MTFDLTNLSGGEIAALAAIATLTAAFIGGIVALIVAFVNAKAVRSVARFNARTAYQQAVCKPLLERMDAEVIMWGEVVERLTRFQPNKSHEEWLKELGPMFSPHLTPSFLDTTPLGVQSMLRSDYRLYAAFESLSKRRDLFVRRVLSAVDEQVDHPGNNRALLSLLDEGSELVEGIVKMRMAIERHMFT